MMNDEREKENPKFETRNSKQIQITKIQMTEIETAAFGGKIFLF